MIQKHYIELYSSLGKQTHVFAGPDYQENVVGPSSQAQNYKFYSTGHGLYFCIFPSELSRYGYKQNLETLPSRLH